MKVLLTGATGFVGSHVAKLLVQEGCQVYALVRPTSNTWRIEDTLSSIHVLRGDLYEEPKSWFEGIKPDLCIHLAWYVEPGKYLTSPENPRLVSATLSLASHLVGAGCKRFIGVGTCIEYDTDLGCLSESSATKPRSLYAASKLALCLVLEQLARVSKIRVTWLRLFYLYGPFEDKRRLMASVICSLLKNQTVETLAGEYTRDYLHIEDVAAAIWEVAKSNLSGVVNIGSGRAVTVREIVMKVGEIMGRKERIKLGSLLKNSTEPMFVCADNQRLTKNTRWSPRFDLDKGLSHTIDWWRANGSF